jgi:hypothetical protein
MGPGERFEEMVASLKKAAAALRGAGVPFAVAGGFAAWARGGSASDHDVDFFLPPDHVDRALAALADAGLRTERPPEGWLVKGYDGDVLVDLIFEPSGITVDEEFLARCDVLPVQAMEMCVISADDLLITKLLAATEHHLDFEGLIEVCRALREQVDWAHVEQEVKSSPFARAFLYLARELGIAADCVTTTG